MKPPGDVVAVPFPYWASAVALSDAQDDAWRDRASDHRNGAK